MSAIRTSTPIPAALRPALVTRQTGIRQRSLGPRCRLGRATELVFVLVTGLTLVLAGGAQAQAVWDGTTGTDFTDPTNYIGDADPLNNDVTLDDGGVTQPTLAAGAFTINSGAISAGILTIDGELTATTGVTLSGDGNLTIGTTGEVIGDIIMGSTGTLLNDGGAFPPRGVITGNLTVNSGTVNNSGTITGNLTVSGGDVGTSSFVGGTTTITGGTVTNFFQVQDVDNSGSGAFTNSSTGEAGAVTNAATGANNTGGVIGSLVNTGGTFDNGGTILGSVDVDGGAVTLSTGSAIDDTLGGVTVSGTGTLTVNAADTVANVTQTGGTIDGSNTLTTTTFDQSGGDMAATLSASGAKTLEGGTLSGTLTGLGATTIQTGITTVSGSGILVGDVTVDGGGTLRIENGANITGTIITTGSVISYADGVDEDSAINLNSNDTQLSVDAAEAATQSGAIGETAGPRPLEKIGDGNLTLSGANTYTGLTTVTAGTLTAANATALGTDAAGTTVADGATLALQGGITTAEAITLNGTGVGGGGALRNVSGNNTVTGAVTLAGATLITNDDTDFADQLTFTSGITGTDTNLTLAGAGSFNTTGAITTGSGTLTKDGTGIAFLQGVNTFTGATTINGGSITVNSGSALSDTALVTINAPGLLAVQTSETVGNITGSGQINLFTGATLTAGDATATSTFSGAIVDNTPGDAGNFTKAGTGTLTLSGANTYTGATTVSGGTLDVTGSVASATVAVNTGGTLQVDGASLLDTAAVTLDGTGNLTLTGAETIGSLASASGTSTVTLNANTLTTGDATDTEFRGVISGDGGLTKEGSGSFMLSGANDYTGATAVNDGTLDLDGSGAIASTVVGTASGATLTTDGGGLNTNAVITNEGTLALTGGGGEVVDSVSGAGGIDLSSGSVLTLDAGTSAITGVISGDGGLTVEGTSATTLSGANTYEGDTTVTAGTLTAANDTALGTTTGATTVADGATLALTGDITTAEAITLNGTGVGDGGALRNLTGINVVTGVVTLATDTRINSDADQLELNGGVTGTDTDLTVGGTGITLIASDITTGAGSLTVDATGPTGILGLAGANTFTGGTTVNSGFLQLNQGSALADTGALVVNAPGTVQVFDGETVGDLSGDGSIVLQTSDALVAGGTGTTVFSGVISEFAATGTFTKAGAGTLTLSGVNTYTGATTVSAGTLALTGAGAIASTTVSTAATSTLSTDGGALNTNAVVTNAGTLALTGGETVNSVSGAGGVSLSSGTVLTLDAGTSTISGVISGDGGLAITGTSSTALSGANTFAGGTTKNTEEILGNFLQMSPEEVEGLRQEGIL